MTPKKQIVMKNRVKEYCDNNKISFTDFLVLCLQAPTQTETGRALSVDTATRIYKGETQIGLQTAGLVAKALGASLGDIFDVE